MWSQEDLATNLTYCRWLRECKWLATGLNWLLNMFKIHRRQTTTFFIVDGRKGVCTTIVWLCTTDLDLSQYFWITWQTYDLLRLLHDSLRSVVQQLQWSQVLHDQSRPITMSCATVSRLVARLHCDLLGKMVASRLQAVETSLLYVIGGAQIGALAVLFSHRY